MDLAAFIIYDKLSHVKRNDRRRVFITELMEQLVVMTKQCHILFKKTRIRFVIIAYIRALNAIYNIFFLLTRIAINKIA